MMARNSNLWLPSALYAAEKEASNAAEKAERKMQLKEKVSATIS